MISESNFNKLAKQGYNRIPLMCEILADLDTPLSTYTKICNLKYSYLFESVEGGDKWGRYSIIGLPAKKIISVSGKKITIKENNKHINEYNANDPLAEFEKLQQAYKTDRNNPDILNYLGFTLRKTGKLEEAEKYYLAGLKIKPNHNGINEYLGELYVNCLLYTSPSPRD